MRMGGIRNKRNYWVNEAQTYAVWSDGESGSSQDWVFGPYGKLRDDSGLYGYLFSNTATYSPCDDANWTSRSGTPLTTPNKISSKPVDKEDFEEQFELISDQIVNAAGSSHGSKTYVSKSGKTNKINYVDVNIDFRPWDDNWRKKQQERINASMYYRFHKASLLKPPLRKFVKGR